jgi:hypothetical protein
MFAVATDATISCRQLGQAVQASGQSIFLDVYGLGEENEWNSKSECNNEIS